MSSPVDSVEIISLEYLREHLNITETGEDEELQRFLVAASLAVEEFTGQIWSRRTLTDEVFVVGGEAYLQPPVMSVTSATTLDGETELTTPTIVDGFTGAVAGVENGWALITYVAGVAAIPEHVRLATAIIAGHLWNTQRVPTVSTLSVLENAPVSGGRGYLIPYQAAQLLGGKAPNRP